jgi:acyl carrier protein
VSPEEARAAVLDALAEVAPEADPAALDPDVDLFAQVDLDSMDFLTVLEILHERTGVEIPESDYGALGTIAKAAAYVAERAP